MDDFLRLHDAEVGQGAVHDARDGALLPARRRGAGGRRPRRPLHVRARRPARRLDLLLRRQRTRRCIYNSGYDPQYAYLSVGLLSKAACLRHAIEDGRKRLDFLRGNEPYKYDLGGKDLQVYRCLIKKA